MTEQQSYSTADYQQPTTPPIGTMPPTMIRGSEGAHFQIGNTTVYVGPRPRKPNDRHLRRPPIIAIDRPGEPEAIVAEFPNSTGAETFVKALQRGIDEMRGAIMGAMAELDAARAAAAEPSTESETPS